MICVSASLLFPVRALLLSQHHTHVLYCLDIRSADAIIDNFPYITPNRKLLYITDAYPLLLSLTHHFEHLPSDPHVPIPMSILLVCSDCLDLGVL